MTDPPLRLRLRYRAAGLLTVAAVVALIPVVLLRGRPSGDERASSGCFRYAVRTDQPVYSRTARVGVIVAATNTSRRSCLGKSCGGVTPWFEVTDASGHQVYRTFPVGVACARNSPPAPAVRPGGRQVWRDGWWAPSASGRAGLPPGRYRVTWHWLPALSVTGNWFWIHG